MERPILVASGAVTRPWVLEGSQALLFYCSLFPNDRYNVQAASSSYFHGFLIVDKMDQMTKVPTTVASPS